jgi:hypothetical protein
VGHPAYCTIGTGSVPEKKQPGSGFDHPPPHPTQSNAEVKERVELYRYSPSGPSWPFLGQTLFNDKNYTLRCSYCFLPSSVTSLMHARTHTHIYKRYKLASHPNYFPLFPSPCPLPWCNSPISGLGFLSTLVYPLPIFSNFLYPVSSWSPPFVLQVFCHRLSCIIN